MRVHLTDPPRDIYVLVPKPVSHNAKISSPPPAPAPAHTTNLPVPAHTVTITPLPSVPESPTPPFTASKPLCLSSALFALNGRSRDNIGVDVGYPPVNDEAVRMQYIRESPDLPTAPASDLTTPSNVSEIDKWLQADVWRHSMNNVFGCILQAATFAPASA